MVVWKKSEQSLCTAVGSSLLHVWEDCSRHTLFLQFFFFRDSVSLCIPGCLRWIGRFLTLMFSHLSLPVRMTSCIACQWFYNATYRVPVTMSLARAHHVTKHKCPGLTMWQTICYMHMHLYINTVWMYDVCIYCMWKYIITYKDLYKSSLPSSLITWLFLTSACICTFNLCFTDSTLPSRWPLH